MTVMARQQASRSDERPKGLELQARLNELASRGADGVCDLVSEILAEGVRRGASGGGASPIRARNGRFQA